MVYILRFFLFKKQFFFIFLMSLVPVLSTFYIQGVLKFKKNNSGAKRLNHSWKKNWSFGEIKIVGRDNIHSRNQNAFSNLHPLPLNSRKANILWALITTSYRVDSSKVRNFMAKGGFLLPVRFAALSNVLRRPPLCSRLKTVPTLSFFRSFVSSRGCFRVQGRMQKDKLNRDELLKWTRWTVIIASSFYPSKWLYFGHLLIVWGMRWHSALDAVLQIGRSLVRSQLVSMDFSLK